MLVDIQWMASNKTDLKTSKNTNDKHILLTAGALSRITYEMTLVSSEFCRQLVLNNRPGMYVCMYVCMSL